MVDMQPIVMSPFGPLFGTHRYNSQSIPLFSNPFSFRMPNMTSQFSSSILVKNTNPSFVLGGMPPLHIPLSFGGAHIPLTNPTTGSQPSFPLGSNPSLNAPRWSNQPSGQVTSYVPSFTPSSSKLIPTNMFGTTNPPLSFGFPPVGIHFHNMVTIHPGGPLAKGNVSNPHYNIPTRMFPNQILMNQFVGCIYNLG
jgi:hypothetical protein